MGAGMKFKYIDVLKGCVALQRQLDVMERQLTWFHTTQTGGKQWFKRYFTSRWNSEPVAWAVVGLWMALGAVLSPLSWHTCANLVFVFMGAAPFLVVLPIEKTCLTGKQARWSLKQKTCEPQVLDAMMAVFQQRFPALAQSFVEQLGRLKSKGLTPQQAAMIARTLQEHLCVSKDDAIACLIKQDDSCLDVCAQPSALQTQTTTAPFLRL